MICQPNPHTAPEIVAEIDRPIINAAGESVRHLLVTVRAPQPARDPDAHRDPLNLGLVIDASGSMSGPPLDAAKQATLDVLGLLAATDHMSLISFASDVRRHAAAVQLTPTGRTQIEKEVRRLATRGSTDLAGGWLAGCEAVAERQAACGVLERNHVVLLSDGHANEGLVDPAALAEHAGELRRRGIVTSTVGIGTGYSPTQLQAIAEAGGGRMHDAELPHEIAQIVMAELSDTLATTVENLELSLRLPAGATAELYGTAPCTQTTAGCDVLAGSMIGGGIRRLVIKLRLPKGDAGSTLAVGLTARWTVPGEATTYGCDVATPSMTFATAQECLDQPRNRELATIVVEQWQAHVYHRAMVLNQDGQGRAAAKFVQQQLAYLRRYCEGFPELEHEIESLGRFGHSVEHCYSGDSSKELLLKAYKMGRGESDRRRRTQVSFRQIVNDELARRGHQP